MKKHSVLKRYYTYNVHYTETSKRNIIPRVRISKTKHESHTSCSYGQVEQCIHVVILADHLDCLQQRGTDQLLPPPRFLIQAWNMQWQCQAINLKIMSKQTQMQPTIISNYNNRNPRPSIHVHKQHITIVHSHALSTAMPTPSYPFRQSMWRHKFLNYYTTRQKYPLQIEAFVTMLNITLKSYKRNYKQSTLSNHQPTNIILS